LANAIISWKFRHAHDVEGFHEVDECLAARKMSYEGPGISEDAAPRELAEDDATSIDI